MYKIIGRILLALVAACSVALVVLLVYSGVNGGEVSDGVLISESILAFACFVILCVWRYIQKKFEATDEYAKAMTEKKSRLYDRMLSKGELSEYIVDASGPDSRETFAHLLQGKGFSAREWQNGYIFFHAGDNVYSQKEPIAEVFFLPALSVKNSFQADAERASLEKLHADLQAFVRAEGLSRNFIECTVVFRHDALTAEEIRFYHTFGGLRKAEDKNGRDLTNCSYGYCGLDRGRGRLYGPVEAVTDRSDSPTEMMLLLILEAECVPYHA